jgi:predicted enzyme related to lactoylglutathione lyase
MKRTRPVPIFIAFGCVAAGGLLAAGCGATRAADSATGQHGAGAVKPSERAAVTNPVNYFEIPVLDMTRAMRFYERVLLVDFESTEIDGHPMALFPYDSQGTGISGALAHGDSYRPGPQGVRIYFSVANIDETLRRAVEAGGKVLYPKTSIGEHGFVAEFEDSEGNCIAIRSAADSSPN